MNLSFVSLTIVVEIRPEIYFLSGEYVALKDISRPSIHGGSFEVWNSLVGAY